MRIEGLLWIIMRDFYHRGHVGVEPSDYARFGCLLPPDEPAPRELLAIILLTIQTLACTPNANVIHHLWAANEGHLVVLGGEMHQIQLPPITPWSRPDLWPFDDWAFAVAIVNRFLAPTVPPSEEAFCASIGPLYREDVRLKWA